MRKLNQRGSFIVWLTLAFALLGTFIGFALDFGHAYLKKARLARLVDAAAIVAAKVVKGQAGNIAAATRAGCDSMTMNGAPVVMADSTTCASTTGQFVVNFAYPQKAVDGGPPLTHVQVQGSELMPTTFLRFLGWMAPGDYSTINIGVLAEAGPERPIDLVLVLDRSGSMSGSKITALKNTVNEFLDNNFTGNDRIGMVSFAYRGCGNASGNDNTSAINCTADVPLTDATVSNIASLKTKINGLDAQNGTNTMEALRTARTTITPAFDDITRQQTRKVVLLVTDGKPTAMRRNTDDECRRDPKTNATVTEWDSAPPGSFPNGCIQIATQNDGSPTSRLPLNLSGGLVNASGNALFLNTISCMRALAGCNGSYGAMKEADELRNCGFNNSNCSTGGNHDVLVFAIGIGTTTTTANTSFDKHARCLLARIANATDILNTGNNTVQTLDAVCTPPPPSYADNDTYLELRSDWPLCPITPCINNTQKKGKVYVVDQTGNIEAQLKQVFDEISAILKLRLTV
jgi:hypothetical protein